MLQFRRVDPKQPDTGSPDTAGPLAFAIHNQRITVRHARWAGYIGMGGEGEHRHQGGGRGEHDGQDNRQASVHDGMVQRRRPGAHVHPPAAWFRRSGFRCLGQRFCQDVELIAVRNTKSGGAVSFQNTPRTPLGAHTARSGLGRAPKKGMTSCRCCRPYGPESPGRPVRSWTH